MSETIWQILDGNSIWMKEFASALARRVSAVCWSPVMRPAGVLERWERRSEIADPPLELMHFPLQRGYAKPLVRRVHAFESRLLRRMRARCPDATRSPLVCSTPFYAPVAERWPGPVIYYVTDLTVAYEGLGPRQVLELDTRLCRVAAAVCPNSARIAEYLVREAGCSPAKVTIVPNATRAANLAKTPLLRAEPLPGELAHLSRPIAGVIGNLAGNMDWRLLAEAIAKTSSVNWVFVGPTDMLIADPQQDKARAWVMRHATFTGARPYGSLQTYARCFDVALLPYLKKEPTYSGSSTRFYEHLAACRPMLATRGFAELLSKPPLLELVDTAVDIAQAFERLASTQFQDGWEMARWEASGQATWEMRVEALMATLVDRKSKSEIESGGDPQVAPERANGLVNARRAL